MLVSDSGWTESSQAQPFCGFHDHVRSLLFEENISQEQMRAHVDGLLDKKNLLWMWAIFIQDPANPRSWILRRGYDSSG